jgi:hypothetical protein
MDPDDNELDVDEKEIEEEYKEECEDKKCKLGWEEDDWKLVEEWSKKMEK